MPVLAQGGVGAASEVAHAQVAHVQGELVGEVTDRSALLQSRLTAPGVEPDGDVRGLPGVARFELDTGPDFGAPRRTPWLEAGPESDFVVKALVEDLQPLTRYHYRLVFGPDRETARPGKARTFRTHPGASRAAPVSFVVFSCMNHAAFHRGLGPIFARRGPYEGPDKEEGYPALETIRALEPDFVVGNGDNVYYDREEEPAEDAPAMRAAWHRQLAQPRFVRLFAGTATYWTKDDHDFRFDDADLTGDDPPSPELGIAIFREQVPVVPPGAPDAVTYRTHRVSRDLQIWLVEGRDHRSPNDMDDGPEKSLWGTRQRDWLERTLAESDAAFRVVISPTPLVGPDDRWKNDNHANPRGFQVEGESFLAWAKEQGLVERLLLVTGDRHWQYHSVHPTGFHEFSSGALHDENSRTGRRPGQTLSTDPDGKIEQLFIQEEKTGGFLHVRVDPLAGGRARLSLSMRDEHGSYLHRYERVSGATD